MPIEILGPSTKLYDEELFHISLFYFIFFSYFILVFLWFGKLRSHDLTTKSSNGIFEQKSKKKFNTFFF